jgi:hypothetical protein
MNEYEMSPTGCVEHWPQLVELFWEVVKTLEGGTWLQQVSGVV